MSSDGIYMSSDMKLLQELEAEKIQIMLAERFIREVLANPVSYDPEDSCYVELALDSLELWRDVCEMNIEDVRQEMRNNEPVM